MELILHILTTVSPVGWEMVMLGLGKRTLETQFFCPRGEPAVLSVQKVWLGWLKQDSSGVTQEIKILKRVVLKQDQHSQVSSWQTVHQLLSADLGRQVVNSFALGWCGKESIAFIQPRQYFPPPGCGIIGVYYSVKEQAEAV